ncbi:MAG: hypothetical protein ACQEP7_00315 [bacterium]
MDMQIVKLGRWLEQFPYENLSKRKIMKPRDVDVVYQERKDFGAGGTCFSLVNLGAYKARKMGLKPRYYLGDRPDGDGRHCVLAFPEEEVFLDPGYLCYQPLPLEFRDSIALVRPHNTLMLTPEGKNRIRVSTRRKGQETWRYTLNCSPVGRARFEEAWKDSFNWYTVMNSVCLTRLRENDMICFLNGRLQSISREERKNIELPRDTDPHRFLARLFRVDPDLMEEWDLEITSNQD